MQSLPLNASLNPSKTEDLLMPRYTRPWRNMPGEIYLKGGSKIWPLIRKMLHHPQQKIPLGACWAKHEHFCAIHQIWSLRIYLISKKLKVHRYWSPFFLKAIQEVKHDKWPTPFWLMWKDWNLPTHKKLNFPFCTLAGKFHTIVHKNGFEFSTKNLLEMQNVLLLLFPRRGGSQQGQAWSNT